MKGLEQVFNWMLVIGLVLMVGRFATAAFMYFDIPFTSFFKDYGLVSFLILIVGVIGTEVMKSKKK